MKLDFAESMYDAMRVIYHKRGRLLPPDFEKVPSDVDTDGLDDIANTASTELMKVGFSQAYKPMRSMVQQIQENLAKEYISDGDHETGAAIASYKISDDDLFRVLLAAYKGDEDASKS